MNNKKINLRSNSLKTKESKMNTNLSTNEIETVNRLNDDCLINIFEYLTIYEKLKIELVCSNWNRVGKLSWNRVKSLNVYEILPYKNFDEGDYIKTRKNASFLTRVLERCGVYINILTICSYITHDILDNFPLIDKISHYCKNLTELKLIKRWKEIDTFELDESLKNLFIENPSISSLSLIEWTLNGNCLLHLDFNRIKKLRLDHAEFNSIGHFYGFLANLKNLDTFQIEDDVENVVRAIDALTIGKCENIIEININFHRLTVVSNLALFLSKQKKIRKITLCNVSFEETSADSFEEIDLGFDKVPPQKVISNITSFLSKQRKIQRLWLKNVLISSNFIKLDLEELYLHFSERQSNENAKRLVSFISKQQNIRDLSLHKVPLNEKLFKSLPTECLRVLNLSFCETESETELVETLLSFLDRFQKLKVFRPRFDIVNDNYLKIITKLINKNVKSIEIQFYDCLPPNPNIKQTFYFHRLQKLESLIIDYWNDDCIDYIKYDIDNILENLSVCKKLKYLKIHECKFSVLGINGIGRIPNLRILKTSFCENTEEEYLEIIKKSLNLKKLKISYGDKVTENLIPRASEIKIKRGDTHRLFIEFGGECSEINYYELKNAPLVEIVDKDEISNASGY